MSELSEMIAETAGKVFADASPADGFDAAVWKRIEEAGLDRVLLSEEQGGAGEDFEAAVAVARAAGAAAASVPICETLVANWVLAKVGGEVEAGPKALALLPPSWGSDGEGGIEGRLAPGLPPHPPHKGEGRGAPLPWAPIASCALRLQGRTLVFVRAKSKVNSVSVAGEPCAPVDVTDAPSHIFPVPPELPSALYATLIAASLSGAMGTINAMTFEYANTRKQFGRTLGAFQAIQHMAARMAEEAAATEAAVQVAARELAGDNSLWYAAVAKGRASEAAGKIAASAHQIHGAIGFTREYALHRYTRRLWAWRDRAGSEQHWYELIGRAAQTAGRDGLWPGITAGLKL